MPCSRNGANAASTHFVKCGVRVLGRREEPDTGKLRPESKPQELPVSGKDGDMEVYVF